MKEKNVMKLSTMRIPVPKQTENAFKDESKYNRKRDKKNHEKSIVW